MKIPNTWRKKALFIIDVQPSFIIERNKYIIPRIQKIIKNINYDLIISSITYNKSNTQWDKQIGWLELQWKKENIIPELSEILKTKNHIKVEKITRSIFKADTNILEILKKEKIEEIHLVWYETNDCIMASCFESIDLNFYTFVIEEACETRTTASNHTKAIDILKYLNLTNNSNFIWNDKINYFII